MGMQITTQLALFLDNRPGTLARVCEALAEAKSAAEKLDAGEAKALELRNHDRLTYLRAIEALVPGALLDLDEKGDRLSVEVGGYRTTLTVQKLASFGSLEAELRRVAAILEVHVDAKEVPFPEIEYAIINERKYRAAYQKDSLILHPEIITYYRRYYDYLFKNYTPLKEFVPASPYALGSRIVIFKLRGRSP